MDELNDLRDIVDRAGSPAPADLPARLWPSIQATYRHVTEGADSSTPAAIEALPLGDPDPGTRCRSGLWLVAAAALLLIVGFVALSGTNEDTEIADPPPEINDDDPGFDGPATCRALVDAIERNDAEAAATSVRALVEAIDLSAFPTTPATTQLLRRADGAFTQASGERAAGLTSAALASEEFAFDTLREAIDLDGVLTGCPPR